MGLVAKDKKGGEDFTPVPAGVSQAICIGIWDLGTQHNEMYNKDVHRCMIMWEFPEHRISIEKEGEPKREMPMVLSKEYTVSLHSKSSLRKDLEGWREKQFTEVELDGFELKVLLGVNCMIQVIHNTKGEGEDKKTYANVNSIMKLQKGITSLEPEHEPVLFDLDNGEPIPDSTHDWIANKIRKSPEFQEANPESSRGYPGSQPSYPEDGDPGYTPDDDDIPF